MNMIGIHRDGGLVLSQVQFVLIHSRIQLRDVVVNDVNQSLILLLTLGILLQDVINRHELESLIAACRSLPEFVRLFSPVFLLDWVIDPQRRLRPGVHEGEAEGLVDPELLLELSVELPHEPFLVPAVVRHQGAGQVPLIDCVLAVFPFTDFNFVIIRSIE